MSARSKTVAFTIAIVAVLLVSAVSSLGHVSASGSGGIVDLFSQKFPNSGAGHNVPCDAFGLSETVHITALVTYNDYPVMSQLVAFGVYGPRNPVQNVSLTYTGITNDSGITEISFAVKYLSDSTESVFGTWTVIGNANITENIKVSDTLTFQVGWIVSIDSIRTINSDFAAQDKFVAGPNVGTELGLKNIAMLDKTATATVTILDSRGYYIGSAQMDNIVVPANQTIRYVDLFFDLPNNASLGTATIYANVYTASIVNGGVPYSPQVDGNFLVIRHDVGIVLVQPSTNIIRQGDTLFIDVTARNHGSESEDVVIHAFANETMLGSQWIYGIPPLSMATVTFSWNTTGFAAGSYLISATVPPVNGEIDESDNFLSDGYVQVTTIQPQYAHDIAIASVTPSMTLANIGQTVQIVVIAKNLGNYSESFNITAFRDSKPVGIVFVPNLAAQSQTTLTFHWNTWNEMPGNYTIKAIADAVSGEEYLENNEKTDGKIQLIQATGGLLIPDWLGWPFFAVLGILLLLILLILLFRRRRKDDDEFTAGWTAWFYGHDVSQSSR